MLSFFFFLSIDGRNFSLGERQLLLLARVILRKPKILIFDEATASLDQKTDRIVQEAIRTHFSSSTILTIAHRLDTIQDSDLIIVLDNGSIIEMDTPENLRSNPDSLYSKMLSYQITDLH